MSILINRGLKDQASIQRRPRFLFIYCRFIGIATGIYSTIFNNFLNDVFHPTAEVRALEFPREMPGASIMIVLGFLAFLGDIRVAIVSMVICICGMLE